jgi:hypothetical protein
MTRNPLLGMFDAPSLSREVIHDVFVVGLSQHRVGFPCNHFPHAVVAYERYRGIIA